MGSDSAFGEPFYKKEQKMRVIEFRAKPTKDANICEEIEARMVDGFVVGSLVMGNQPYIFGDLTYDEESGYTRMSWYVPVIPETIGQYTGYEVGGKKLFEGDIAKMDYEPAWDEEAGEYRYSQTAWGVIVFENGMFLFKEYRGVYNTNPHIERDLFVWQVHEMYEGTLLKIRPGKFVKHAKHAEIIGNIFDNSELLEEER